jgi:hypothetical protein
MILESNTMSVVHLENRMSGLFFQDEKALTEHKESVNDVPDMALGAEQTAAAIARAAERIRGSE